MNLAETLRATNIAVEHVQPVKQQYDPLICQCCGHTKQRPDDPECVCDGITWHMDKAGNVECEAHRFARAVGGGKRSFAFWRKR